MQLINNEAWDNTTWAMTLTQWVLSENYQAISKEVHYKFGHPALLHYWILTAHFSTVRGRMQKQEVY